MKRATAGFTLMELVISLMIIAILAAVLTPVVSQWIDEGRITRAARETQAIADGILAFNRDTGKWPVFTTGANITTTTAFYDVLFTEGTLPSGSGGWASVNRFSMSSVLEANSPGYTTTGRFAWRGPYVTGLGSDPWGRAYMVNAGSLRYGVNKAGFVVSAGPDGTIQTPFDQDIGSGSAGVTISGDDIVARVR